MNLNKKRHKLLELLSKHRNNVELNKAKYDALGISFSDLYAELNCNDDLLQIITAELYVSDEIGYHDAYNVIGLFAKDKGLSAFSNRKYIKLWWDNLFNISKNIVQIFIPVLSLIIAYIALTTKSNQNRKQSEKELQEVKELLLKQQKDIKALEYRIEKNQTEKNK
jgi:predicted membrane protein